MIFFFVSFVYNYFLGKNQNDKHALVWYQSNKEYFEERYDYFGVDDDDKLKKSNTNTEKKITLTKSKCFSSSFFCIIKHTSMVIPTWDSYIYYIFCSIINYV